MKAIFKAALLAATLLALTACHKEYVTDGPDMKTVKINVSQDAWQYSNALDNNYFFATVKMPEINASVFKEGLVKMYRVYDWDTANASQTELPYVRLNEYENQDGEWIFFTETIDYQFSAGEVTIFYTAGDFQYEINNFDDDPGNDFNPGPMEFRCVVVY